MAQAGGFVAAVPVKATLPGSLMSQPHYSLTKSTMAGKTFKGDQMVLSKMDGPENYRKDFSPVLVYREGFKEV